MTTDLWMLVASALLHWVLIMVAAGPRLIGNGIPWGLGNRDAPTKEPPAWALRAQRASDNMNENLVIAAIVIVVVHISGSATATSALGASLFFFGRLGHALIYAAGVPGLRTLAWTVSIVGLAMVGSALF